MAGGRSVGERLGGQAVHGGLVAAHGLDRGAIAVAVPVRGSRAELPVGAGRRLQRLDELVGAGAVDRGAGAPELAGGAAVDALEVARGAGLSGGQVRAGQALPRREAVAPEGRHHSRELLLVALDVAERD